MADNTTLSVGTADGDTFAADDIGGVKYPISKLAFGALDSQTIASSGAGAVNAGVQRTTLASDDPAVALLTTIDADTNVIQGAVAAGQMQVDIVADGAGLATNAAQLPDGHNVTVDNASIVVTATNLDCQSGGADMATAAGQLADGHNVTVDNASIVVTATNLDCQSGGVDMATAANQVAKATGGMSYDQLAMAAEDNDKVIKGSAGTLYFISAQSIDATPVYLKFFDAASITPGTTSADFQFLIPSQGDANGAGLVLNFGPHGIEMATGIVALVSTAIALDGNTAVSANEVVVTIGFE